MIPAMVNNDFAPTGIWRNGHVQSIVGSLKLRGPLVRRRARKLQQMSRTEILDCGQDVRLTCLRTPQPQPAAPIAVLIHGWEGSAQSLYLLSAAASLYDQGFEVCRLQLRDHGDSHALNEGLFHSCRLDEVVGGVAAIQRGAPGRPLCLGGFSLGANFSLRVAARAPSANIDIAQVVAICPVLDPPTTLDALEQGLWLYNYYFMRKWRRSLRLKHRHWPERYNLDQILAQPDMRQLTSHLVTEYSDFSDLQSYLSGYAITGDVLAGLRVPSLLVAAEDDPIIPIAHLDQVATSEALQILRTAHGGHCGYLRSFLGWSWADEVLSRSFSAAVGLSLQTMESPLSESDAA